MARLESGSEMTQTPAGEGYPVIISATAPTKVRFPALIVGQLWLDTTVPQLKRCTNADTPTYTSAEGTAYTHPNHSGDVTSVADGAQTIADAAVTLAKMANLATARVVGRTTAGTGVPEAVTIGSAAGNVAAGDHTHAAAGAVTREGGNTTEATTTSVGAVDLLAAASLTIASGEVCLAVVGWRRAAGVATAVQAGFKVNATQVNNTTNISTADAAAQNGMFRWLFTAGGVAGYTSAAIGHYSREYDGTITARVFAGAMPTAAVTDLVYTAAAANASNTIGMDEMQVYSYAAS